MHFAKPTFPLDAEVNIVLVVYTHRVKQFQEESGGDPSALLIPALLDNQVPVGTPVLHCHVVCPCMLTGMRSDLGTTILYLYTSL